MALVSCPTCHAAVEATVETCPLCRTPLGGPAARIGDAVPEPSGFGAPVMPAAAPVTPGWGAAPPPMATAATPVAPAPPGGPAPAPRRRSRTRLLLPLLVVVALGAAAVTWWTTRSDGDDAWTSTTTASGRFRVQLPQEPTRTTETVEVAGSALVVDLLSVGELSLEKVAPGTMFLEVDISADPAISQLATDPGLAPTLLYAQAGAVFSTAGLELGPMDAATSELGPAIRVSGTLPAEKLVARGWMVGTAESVLAVLVITPADNEAKAVAIRDQVVASVERS